MNQVSCDYTVPLNLNWIEFEICLYFKWIRFNAVKFLDLLCSAETLGVTLMKRRVVHSLWPHHKERRSATRVIRLAPRAILPRGPISGTIDWPTNFYKIGNFWNNFLWLGRSLVKVEKLSRPAGSLQVFFQWNGPEKDSIDPTCAPTLWSC
jgi:hypothetical protein